MRVGQGDPKRIDKFNTQIYSEFCKIEGEFYRYATNKGGVGKPIDLKRFFGVKGIGDEIWILCEAQADEVKWIGERLIDAALNIANKSIRFLATERDQDPMNGFSRDFDYGAIEPICSPIKVFIDTIEHASSLGNLRDDYLLQMIPQIRERSHGAPVPAAEITEVANRLCFGTSEARAWSRLQRYRTDYIGHEIDRFFRSTKAALPGTVAIGKTMADRLGLQLTGPKDGINNVLSDANTALRGGDPFDPIHYHSRLLTDEEMKGIGYSYITYILFSPRALNGLYQTSRTQKEQRIPTSSYEETQKLLSAEAVHSAANLYYPKSTDANAELS